MNKITIKGLKQPFHIGCYEEERAKLQELRFDIELEFSMELAARSDDIHDTIDYVAVASVVQRLGETGRWSLVEKLCRDLSESILLEFPALDAVTVHLTKRIPIPCDGIVCSYRSAKR